MYQPGSTRQVGSAPNRFALAEEKVHYECDDVEPLGEWSSVDVVGADPPARLPLGRLSLLGRWSDGARHRRWRAWQRTPNEFFGLGRQRRTGLAQHPVTLGDDGVGRPGPASDAVMFGSGQPALGQQLGLVVGIGLGSQPNDAEAAAQLLGRLSVAHPEAMIETTEIVERIYRVTMVGEADIFEYKT